MEDVNLERGRVKGYSPRDSGSMARSIRPEDGAAGELAGGIGVAGGGGANAEGT